MELRVLQGWAPGGVQQLPQAFNLADSLAAGRVGPYHRPQE